MARIRSIKPEFFDHEQLCELSFAHRLCFIGLWTQADKAGRMEDRPTRLKARIFPYDDVDMEGLLSDLSRDGFIVRYQVAGQRYLAIPEKSWKEHQRPRKDEHESLIPPVDSGVVTDTSLHSDEPVTRVCDSDTHKSVGGRREEVGSRGEEKSVSPEPPSDSEPDEADEAVAVFSVVGVGGPEWALRESQVESWRALYPGVDVMAEVRKALAWLAASPGRRKTAAGMPRFLVNWLNRATDRGGRGGSSAREYSDFEIKKYEDWRRAMGGCGHTPACESRQECMGHYINRLRGAA